MMLDLEIGLTTVGVAGASYLAWRALMVFFRVRWGRHAYPAVVSRSKDSVSERMDRCRGCLVGFGIGDALNLPAESVPRWLARLRYPSGPKMRRGVMRFLRRAGDVSDDTQLTIAVARSIDLTGAYSHERFMDELARWSYFHIGAGRACAKASIHARRRSRRPSSQSKGNGAAIRVAPFAIAFADHASLLDCVQQNARSTHDREEAIGAAVFVSLLIRECLVSPLGLLDDSALLGEAIEKISDASGFGPSSAAIGAPSGHVNECIPRVVAVLLTHGSDFRAAMASVFRGGGDTDSIGAIVGACIGAQVGHQALPSEWTLPLQHHDYLMMLADRLSSPTLPKSCQGLLEVRKGDIVSREVDAVVNAWNRNLVPRWLLFPQGVSRAIGKAGGAVALRHVAKAGPLPLGNALESTAGELAAKWIIHADAIDLSWRSSESSICKATRSALLLAHWLGVRTVALPVLGAGSGGFSRHAAIRLISKEAEKVRDRFDRIEIVVFAGRTEKDEQ